MGKILTAYGLILFMLLGSAALVSAKEKEDVRIDAGSIYIAASEENTTILDTRTFGGDYLGAGRNVSFSGKADDLYLMGKSILYTGRSTGGMLAMGETLEIEGTVDKNLHGVGNSVRITGHAMDTAFLAGQHIVIAEKAVVDGTLLSGSNTLHVIGRLNNGLIAGAGEIIIDGPVRGNVNVRTGNLIITERGSIDGHLIYGSSKELSAAERARVTGSVRYEIRDKFEPEGLKIVGVVAGLLFYLAIAVTGLLLLLLPGVRGVFTRAMEPANYGKTVLWGLIPLFIFPVAVLVTIPLFPLAVALALAAFPLLGLTILLGLALAGQLLFRLFKWQNDSIFLQFLLAFAVFLVLSLIPFVRALVMLAAAAAGSGLILGKLFRTEF